jgi:hypothetical protein
MAALKHLEKDMRLTQSAATLILAVVGIGEAHGGDLKHVPVAELKSAYLACTSDKLPAPLPRAAIMWCSVVYEELKEKAFEGDYEKLLAWSRAQATVAAR